jgi:hypothetical protein
MANLNETFLNFCDKIRLSKSKKENLITSRDTNRDRIKKHFREELKKPQPEFFQQGSFSFKTTINPIAREYDVDDGIYLKGLEENFIDTLAPKTVHEWVAEAVKDTTKNDVIDKPSCVRLVYANDYHIDFPIYGIKNDKYYLAHTKSKSWIENDLKGFNEWFYERLSSTSEQMRRNIIYLKGWADFNGFTNITGILITVLVCQNQISKTDRDDESLNGTVKLILDILKINRSVIMPVVPYDNLLIKYDDKTIDDIISSFEELKEIAQKAITETDFEKAADLWITIFGDRFVLIDKDKNESKAFFYSVPATISKPWCNK